ncbi:hypothetical protein GCK32_005624 [Trichostrongylus colubriformis]|uniref:Uncharacterized protein n=1 Tax=Trichostrongylus colubriformis TaxID=6319 RepID=A0AAN8F374_TRICO
MAVDSPLIGKTSNVGRTSAGADSPSVREGSREREYAKSRVSTDVAPRPSPGPDGLGGRATQTALSIQMPLSSGGDGDVVSRKSSRSERRSASATPSTPASTSRNTVDIQTDEVKFDMEDNIVIGWPLSDAKMIPPPSWNLVVPKNEAPVPKTAHCKNDQNSRIVSWDSVLDGSCDKVCLKKI